MPLRKLIPACVACVGLTAVADDADLFKELDTSGDGVLVASEIAEEKMRFFERLVRVGDANEDGELTRAEFDAALVDTPASSPAPDRLGGRRGRPGGEMEGRRMPSPDEIISRLDTDGDGKVQRSELSGRAEMLGRLMDRLDTDELTLDQLKEAGERMREMMANGRRPEGDRRPEGRERMDRDSDQRPERDGERYRPRGEFRADGDRPMDRPSPDGRLEGPPPFGGRRDGRPDMGPPAFIAILDADKNGRISKLEAVRLIEKFSELDANGDGDLEPHELMGHERHADREGDGRPGMARGPEGRGSRPGPSGFRGRPERDGDQSPMEGRGERPGPPRDGDRPGAAGGRRFGGDPGAFFDRLDVDHSGGISKDEMPGFMAQRFDMLDKNEDGEITKDEFARPEMRRPGGDRGRARPDGARPDGDRPAGERPRRPDADDAA